MTTMLLQEKLAEFLRTSEQNRIPEAAALQPELAGVAIFEAPIMGVAAAFDPYFRKLDESPDIETYILRPSYWLSGAKSVVSFFLPFTEQVRASNRAGKYPSKEWLHGRIEGQKCVAAVSRYAKQVLMDAGYNAVVPSDDERFYTEQFISNWSERHAAYAAGLGTFSLSKSMITPLGSAGRFGSVITTLELPATPRPYSGLYDYCSLCGACVRNCPANAIHPKTGKNNVRCNNFLEMVKMDNAPYYGCGKCQAGTPCEGEIPADRRPKAESPH